MKIGIFTDVHANLPALQKSLETFQEEGCDSIVHCGDLVGIGPYPKECLDLVLSFSNIELIMGNHDYWAGFGLPYPLPHWMSQEEIEHQTWTRNQIPLSISKEIQTWAFKKEIVLSNDPKIEICFLHYGLNENQNWFKSFVKNPNAENIASLFEDEDAAYIFYGHQHIASDFSGESRYINIGSAGCDDKPEAKIAILEFINQKVTIEKRSIPYEDNGLMVAFFQRKVPARDFITKNFIKR